jgi:hypothetical protein
MDAQDCACAKFGSQQQLLRDFAAMTFKERLVADLKRFLTFLFNKNTGEILGRTCFSWSKSKLAVIT